MVLDDNTAQKVAALFSIPCNYVEYAGAMGNAVYFIVGFKCQNNLVSGLHVAIDESFKVRHIQRLKITYNTGYRKIPLKTEVLPFHPLGEIPSIYC